MMKRVKVSLAIYYDEESYIYDWDENKPTDKQILERCKNYFIEDINDKYANLAILDMLHAEFVNDKTPR